MSDVGGHHTTTPRVSGLEAWEWGKGDLNFGYDLLLSLSSLSCSVLSVVLGILACLQYHHLLGEAAELDSLQTSHP